MLWLLKIAVIYNQGGCSSFLAINNIFCRTSKGYPFFLTISMFTWTLTRRNVRSIKLVSCHKSWPLDYLLVSKYSTFYFVYICMYIYIYIYISLIFIITTVFFHLLIYIFLLINFPCLIYSFTIIFYLFYFLFMRFFCDYINNKTTSTILLFCSISNTEHYLLELNIEKGLHV